MGRARRARKTSAAATPPPSAPSLPAASRRAAGTAAGAVLVLALAAYARTLAPTATLVDSGELIVAARTLGVAHPPGFPLYVMLAHAATRLPIGNVAQRVNAFSALCAALAAAALVEVTRRALAAADASGREGWLGAVPLVLAGSLLAVARPLWAYATVAEVYAISTLAVVVLIGLALAARARPTPAAFVLLAAAFGVSAGTHHVTIALCAPALLAIVWTPLRARAAPRLLALCALAGTAGAVLVYLYLPWSAAHARFPNWGDPRTLERVWWHVSGRQYQAFLAPSAASARAEAVAFASALLRAFGPPWLPLALVLAAAGAASLWRRARAVCVALALLVLCDAAYALAYTIAEDKDAYYLPSVVALALLSGVGGAELLARVRRARAAWAVLLLLVPLAGGLLHARPLDRSRFWVAQDFARDALAGVGPGGLLLTAEWQLYSPVLYFQQVEGWRPDVMAVDVSLLRRSWYVEALRARYPERWDRVRAQADSFLEDLRGWEHDPDLYVRDLALNRRITERFQALVVALVATHGPSGRVYATSDVVLTPSPDPALAERLERTFPLTPRGLVFALGPLPPEPPLPDFAPRGLFDGTLALAEDDVARLKVRPVYVSMAVNRGQFLLSRGDAAGGEREFRRALAWDPDSALARAALLRLQDTRAR